MQFLYNENREVVAEKDYSGNIIRYIRGLGLISSDSENAKTYYHYVCDEQGSVSRIIRGEDKENGAAAQDKVSDRVLNHYEYDAFGNTISGEERVANRFRYQTSYGKSREIIQCSDINSKEVAKVEEKVPVSDAVMKSLEGSGLTSDRIKEIRDLPKPDYSKGEFVNRDVNKPDPKTYLNPDYYQKHLEPFEKTGCYRIQRTDPMLPDDQYGGVLGHNSGLFVTSGEDMMKVLKEADGDVSKLEKIFGMDEGDWGKNLVIIRVDDPQHLRIPDGNEMGAWTKYYIPGGFTSGNQAEAVIDSVPRGEYQVMKFNNPELMNWMKKGIGE